MKLLCHMPLDGDTVAPAEPSSAQRHQVRGDSKVIAAEWLIECRKEEGPEDFEPYKLKLLGMTGLKRLRQSI